MADEYPNLCHGHPETEEWEDMVEAIKSL